MSRSAGSAHIALVAGGATLLGGDAVSIKVEVGAGCTLRIEDIGGTVAYPSTGLPSEWTVDVVVGNGGTLVWESFPFVVADRAVVNRRTMVRRGTDSLACLRETLVLGRTGEAGGRIVSSTDIRDFDGKPCFVEELTLDGEQPQPGVLGRARVLDTAIMVGADLAEEDAPASDDRTATREVTSASVADRDQAVADADSGRVLVLARTGAVVRAIGPATHAAHVDATWRRWKNRAERSGQR
ncbi:urease accessory protein UreD [Brevibacterium sp. CCUG 69071]|uniref:urease accessory protein UreD n=1 Tax=Brevibacterium sp. CCUG 69071 TaxID=2052937 RepID=UPI001E3BB624|nr:urease accessory protein UreD [Brevibacterium sp. CCUG 69071]